MDFGSTSGQQRHKLDCGMPHTCPRLMLFKPWELRQSEATSESQTSVTGALGW